MEFIIIGWLAFAIGLLFFSMWAAASDQFRMALQFLGAAIIWIAMGLILLPSPAPSISDQAQEQREVCQ